MVMRTKLLLSLLLLTCCHQPIAPSPSPITPPDTELCGKACTHLKDLNCEEGKDFYDSDKPGPKDQPNSNCEEFCKTSQDRGVFMNPRCLQLVTSCSKVEEFRNREPSTCK